MAEAQDAQRDRRPKKRPAPGGWWQFLELLESSWHDEREVTTSRAVRGHEKVPTGGQVQVPAGGEVEVPALRVSCPGLWALCGDGVGANQITGHRTGASIEEREGTDGRTGRLPGGGQLPGRRGDVWHHAQDGQADRAAAQ